MGDFKLSASLEGHADDVRAVSFPMDGVILSASRDATVQVWKKTSQRLPRYESTLSSHSSSFVNALAFFPPNAEFPQGLIVSGGKDAIIEARQPDKAPEDNAEALMPGHSNNVCALDVSSAGGYIVSGSWDGKARIWKIGKWECEVELSSHEGAVWAVLAFDEDTVITGCADHMIRIFDVRGKLLKVIEGSNDVVRALCRVSSNTADFASAGNDGIIHLWTRDGKRTAQLHGHENFIYSLASFSNGEFVSSGEDRTVRLWRDGICIQTITHPAISVWTVAACDANGDIVSGASDRVVRVFSRAEERQAAADDIKAFQDSVKSSSIPQQQLGGINKEKLPGPAFLQQKSGTKEGQVQIIQEPNGNISAHQWSQATQSWTNVGTVVDAAGSSGRKQTYLGQDYDYVFDVDIEDGKPPLKLPYNVSQNPYEAATKFIQDNELPISYLDQVAAFITQNTQGATLGQQEPASSDAWGTEARYRPDGSTEPPTAQQQPSQRPKVLPQKTYLAIKTADLRTILKKISEFNQKLVQEGSKHDSLGDDLIKILEDARKPLEEALSRGPTKDSTLSDVVPITIHMIEVWPAGFRLPALDLLRLLAAASPALAEYVSSPCVTILETLERYAFDDNERANNVMLGVRTLGNLFETEAGRAIADSHFDKVRLIAKDCADQQSSAPNRNTLNALATLYLNYAVLFTSNQTGPSSSSTGQKRLTVFNDVVAFLKQTSDSEAVYRGLVAAGTILSVGGLEANLVSQIRNTCSEITKKNKETRVQNVCSEIREYAAKQT